MIELLIDGGADIDKGNNAGGTPLYYASSAGEIEIVGLLIQNSASVDLPAFSEMGVKGASPLLAASINAHEEIVRMLLDAGADPNLKYVHEGEEWSVLGFTEHLSQALGEQVKYAQTIEILREYGASLQ